MQNKDIAKTALVRRQKGPILYFLISIVIVVALIAGFFALKKKIDYVGFKNLKIGSETFKLEIANTEAARMKGLSKRDYLAKDNGMLFDFKQDGDWRMWMIDMHFNIDMIWLDKDSKIVHIKNDATPGSYPEAYHAEVLNRYVIELPAGTAEWLGLKDGDKVDVGL